MSVKKKLVVCGGGSSAHTLIPLLKESVFDVSILTSKPQLWNKKIELEYQSVEGNLLDKFDGNIELATNNPSDVVPFADYVILCMPVHKYREALLNEIGPYINRSKKEVFVGTVYGQGGFNWMVDEMKTKNSLDNVVTFSFELIPWISRTITYGAKGVTYGCKSVNVAATYPTCYFEQVNSELFDEICFKWFGKGKTLQSDNFLSFTLSVDNQIIHTSRCLGLYKVYGSTWNSKEDVPMFYKDYDDVSADLLRGLDSDYSKVRDRIKQLYPLKNYEYMLDYLSLERLSYDSSNTDIKQSFVTSQTLTAIHTPVVKRNDDLWELDRNHRFFLDDIFYGNCIVKWMAQKLDIKTPVIDEILFWAQNVRNEKIIDSRAELIVDNNDLCAPLKSGLPCYYGFNSVDDLID